MKKRLIWVMLICIFLVLTTASATLANTATPTKDNDTMMQYFEWYLSEEGAHWSRLGEDAPNLAQYGINAVWIPPAYKGAFGTVDVGYGAYDLYDLGEFRQQGTIRTKYGTKVQLQDAVKKLQSNGVKVYADVVINHKAGGEAIEKIQAIEVGPMNRNLDISAPYEISAYTKFNFPARNGKYSQFTWDARHFNGVNRDETKKVDKLFRFQGKTWDWEVDPTFSNYDYLMFNDVDYDNPQVVSELKNWGTWFVNELNLDGFRLDAVKHIKYDFMRDWLAEVRVNTGKNLFAVAEFWSNSTPALTYYHDKVNKNMSMFDVDLHYRMFNASNGNGTYDMRNIVNGVFSSIRPEHAVTFVDNHDTQPGQSLQSWVQSWFKPQAYALILTRKEGTPMMFYGDYYGIQNNNLPGLKSVLDPLLLARKNFAYGEQFNYLDHADVIGWTRTGVIDRVDSGLAALISDGAAGSKSMFVGAQHAGEVWTDITGNRTDQVTIAANGWATFSVNSRSVSIYVKQTAKTADISSPKNVNKPILSYMTQTTSLITWLPAKDNVGVVKYEVYRNGTKVGETTNLSFADKKLKPNTLYRYIVSALDAAGNYTDSEVMEMRTYEEDAGNKVTIYYKKGFDAPYLHWRTPNGAWSTAPGVEMDPAEYPGYMKATVSIGGANGIEAAFTNLVTWDNNGGKNYTFPVGISTYEPPTATAVAKITTGLPRPALPDTQVPTAPKITSSSILAWNAVQVNWNPSTDDWDVVGYEVFRDDKKVRVVKENFIIETGLPADTQFDYNVYAVDSAGNRSLSSNFTSISTDVLPDTPNTLTIYYKNGPIKNPYIHFRQGYSGWTTPPGYKMQPSANYPGFSVITLNLGNDEFIDAVFTDGGTIWDNNNNALYYIEKNVSTFYPSPYGTGGVLFKGIPSENIWYNPNEPQPEPDLIAPAVPAGLKSSNSQQTSIKLDWSRSTDNVGVKLYELFRDNVKIATLSTLTFTDTDLAVGKSYVYQVRAVDDAGNTSALSSGLQASTLTPPPDNFVTVYYKRGFSVPFIHYRPVGGNWTTAPGVKLLASEFLDYMKITINIGQATRMEASFNNGGTVWDNNNTLNYFFEVGTSTYVPSTTGSAGTITTGIPVVPAPDTTAPTTPGNLTVSGKTDKTVTLTWAPSTDNVQLSSYEVLRAGTVVATVSSTTFTDQNLLASTSYSYSVRATDTSNNRSAASTTVSVTTDTPPPPPPANEVTIYYKRGLATPYIHYRPVGGIWTVAPGIAMVNSEVSGFSKITLKIGTATRIEACFNNGSTIWDNNNTLNYFFNVGSFTFVPSMTGGAGTITSGIPFVPPPDTTAPTIPGNLTVTGKTDSTVTLSWSPSTDNVQLSSYEVLRSGTVVGNATTTTFTDRNLAGNTAYTYTVRALDTSSNRSATSDAVSVMTNTPPPPPPSNEVTIYYKRGFATPYIHYRPVGGLWTVAPGIAMVNSEVSGFSKITLKIGTATRIEVCFNNGSTLWDSNNTLNYFFDAGSYTFVPSTAGGAGTITAGIPAIPTPDTVAPTTPANLTVTSKTDSTVTLSWSASTDNVQLSSYEVLRAGTVVGTVSTTTFTDRNLAGNTAYTYTVRAMDTSSNRSAVSDAVSVSTNTPPPTPPSNEVTIYYKRGYATPYIHYRPVGGTWTIAPGTIMVNSEVSGFSKITLKIGTATAIEACFNNGSGAWDSNGGKNYIINQGSWTFSPGATGSAGTITTGIPTPPAPDTTAPTVPINFGSPGKTDKTISLSWSASSDNVAVTGYEVFRNSIKIATVTGTSYQDSGLSAATAYVYTIIAFDGAGNKSASSAALTVSTNSTPPPPPPGNEVTIYFKRGYSTPFLHYRPVGANWTIAPGVAMVNSEVSGYSKITVNIGTATRLEACFNNGSGAWDSNYGKNYFFNLGTYTYVPNPDGRSAGTILFGKP